MIQLEISDMASMERASAALSHAGESAARDIGVTIKAIDAAGAPWGGDGPGQAFWAAYRGAALVTVTNASQVGPQVEALGINTEKTLLMYRANEAQNAALSGGINA